MSDRAIGWLPEVGDFLGLCSLKCGCILVALIGIIHPITFFLYYLYETEAYIDDICIGFGAILTIAFVFCSAILLGAALLTEKLLAALYAWYAIAFLFLMALVLIVILIRCCMQERWLLMWLSLVSLLLLYPLVYFWAIVANSYAKKEGEE